MACGGTSFESDRCPGRWLAIRHRVWPVLGPVLVLLMPPWWPAASVSAPIPSAGFSPGSQQAFVAISLERPEPDQARSTAEAPAALRCRINVAPWQACAMEIDRVGEHWWLVFGGRRFEFRHDGHGQVTLSDPVQGSRRVTPEWRGPGVLCWDDLCAEGPIPLD